MRSPAVWRFDPGFESRATEVFGWTTRPELHYLRSWFAREFEGWGAAVELGCALGRSTVAILEGLADNRRAGGAKLDVFDWMKLDWLLLEEYGRFDPEGAAGLREGDDFEPILRRSTAPWADRVRLHVGDIAEARWEGGPIEVLFVDIMKSWPATRGVVRTFYPALVAGRSIVIHQDFKNPYLPHLLLTAYRLRDFFEPEVTVCGERSSTVAFRCVRALDRASIAEFEKAGLFDLGTYTVGEVEAAVDWALAVVAADPEQERDAVLVSWATVWLELMVLRHDSVLAARRVPGWQKLLRERVSRMRPDYGSGAVDPEQLLEELQERERAAVVARDEAYDVLRRIHASRAFKVASWGWRLRRALPGGGSSPASG